MAEFVRSMLQSMKSSIVEELSISFAELCDKWDFDSDEETLDFKFCFVSSAHCFYTFISDFSCKYSDSSMRS